MKARKYLTLISILLGLLSCNCIEECEINVSEKEPIISERLGLKLYHVNDSLYKALYDDGRELTIIENSHDSYTITGSRINNESIDIYFSQVEDNLFDTMEYFDYSKDSTITKDEFVFLVNGYVKSPCSEHEDGESLKNCFKREVDEFCNSLVSCVFLAANARVVATLIAIHCAYCN
jgi:hypothetical protein